MQTVQEFIEQNHPRYYDSEDIAMLDDLTKLTEQSYQESDDDEAYNLLHSDYGGDIDKAMPQILLDLKVVYAKVLEDSILGYIEMKNNV